MDYYVSVDNEESNELGNVLSMTGSVNDVEVAASIRLTSLAGKSKRDQEHIKQMALITAFQDKSTGKTARRGSKVTV